MISFMAYILSGQIVISPSFSLVEIVLIGAIGNIIFRTVLKEPTETNQPINSSPGRPLLYTHSMSEEQPLKLIWTNVQRFTPGASNSTVRNSIDIDTDLNWD